MLYTGVPLFVEMYEDHIYPYTNVKEVYDSFKDKHPGKLVVTNAHWYNPGLQPCGNLKVAGKIISQEYDSLVGFSWNSDELPTWDIYMNKENFLSTIPAIIEGKELDISRYAQNVQRSTTRTWFGFDDNGKYSIEVTTTNYTLTQIVKRMKELNITNGIVLDGSGSSQLYDGETYIFGDKRTIASYLLIWFEEEDDMAQEYWNQIHEIPAWGQPTIQKLINKGVLQGVDEMGNLRLTYDLVRLYVVHDRLGLYD